MPWGTPGTPSLPPTDPLLFADTLRPGTLPSLADMGDPAEAVRREEKKVRPGWSHPIWGQGWPGWGCPPRHP